MSLDDLLGERQADPMAGDIASVQASKDLKDSVFILRLDTDPVIAHRKYPGTVLLTRRDVDLRHDAGPAVLDRVGDEILQNLLNARIGHYFRQRIVRDSRSLAL